MRVVILPGLDGTGKMLDSFTEALKRDHSVELIQYPIDEVLSYSELTNFVEDKLPQTIPYVILAESFSGPVAVTVGSKSPKNLRGLIFAASFLKNPTFLPKSFGALAQFVPIKTPSLLKLAKPLTFGKWSTKRLNTSLATAIKGVSHRVLAKRVRELTRVDAFMTFEKLNLPMLYLRPTADRLVRPSMATKMKALNSGLQIQDIEGSHFILQTNEKNCLDAISKFLKANT